jgi:hypothetical protein
MTTDSSTGPAALGDDAPGEEPDGIESPDPEEFAEEAGIDPTPQQVQEYQHLIEEQAPGSQEPPD